MECEKLRRNLRVHALQPKLGVLWQDPSVHKNGGAHLQHQMYVALPIKVTWICPGQIMRSQK